MGADSYKYQWLRNGVAIPGATTSDYVPGVADWGKSITVRMTMSKANYDTVVVTFAPRDFSLVPSTAKPVITGNVVLGEPLSVATQTYTGPSGPVVVVPTYQWLRNGVVIPGATEATYTPTPPLDSGKAISVRVTVTDPGSVTSISTSLPTQLVGSLSFDGWDTPLPALGYVPATTTLTVLGTGLSAAPSSPALPAPVVAYQWYRGDVAIVGATKASYKLSAADAAKQVWVRVTVSKPTHTTVVKTSPRVDYTVMQDSMPTLASTAWRVGVDAGVTGQSYLTKDGVLASPVLAYQWLRNGVLIAGATQATHPIVAADYNTRLALRITASLAGLLAARVHDGHQPADHEGRDHGHA